MLYFPSLHYQEGTINHEDECPVDVPLLEEDEREDQFGDFEIDLEYSGVYELLARSMVGLDLY